MSDSIIIRGIVCGIKSDHIGFIIDPINLNYSCGWGATLEEARQHFVSRNEELLDVKDEYCTYCADHCPSKGYWRCPVCDAEYADWSEG